jgi:cell division protein FtsW
MKRIDFTLLLPIIFLTLFGILMIYNASSIIAFRDFGDKYHYFKDQLTWMLLGYTALIILSYIDYHVLSTFALPILILAIVILIGVFIPGLGVYALGAHRWINLQLFVLQPAEFIKLSLAIYLSAWFSRKEKGRFFAFCMLIGFVLFLIMLQPDMGTGVIVLSEALVIYFLSGGNVLEFVGLIPILGLGGIMLIAFEPYRAARLTAFFNMHKSLDSTSYHVKQILIALGSGGIFGVGLGNSLQKYEYLPENVTDSIFAIIAEELGFIGVVVLITIFFIVLWRGFSIAIKAKDTFGKLLSGAIVSFLGIQVIINLAAMTALIPLTGIPLPFISYGGSSLVIDLCAIGIMLNISKQSTSHLALKGDHKR